MKAKVWAGAVLLALSCAAPAQVAVLRIQVVEGDGAVHAPGSRAVRPLVVRVTDETGQPVSGAAVSFHLPEDGPGGVFAGGLRTEVGSTDSGGLASLRGLRPNRISGSFSIRIFASKEQARAGVISNQYIADARSGVAAKARTGWRKWIAVAALVSGGAVAGLLAAGRTGGAASQPAAAVAGAPAIGQPAITVGKS